MTFNLQPAAEVDPDIYWTEGRALPVFRRLPPGCATHLHMDEAHEPQIDRGERVVVDTLDREIAVGELMLVDMASGPIVRQIQPGGHDGKGRMKGCFNLVGLNRPRCKADLDRMIDDARTSGRPLRTWSDGPIRGDALREQIVGRVIGLWWRPPVPVGR